MRKVMQLSWPNSTRCGIVSIWESLGTEGHKHKVLNVCLLCCVEGQETDQIPTGQQAGSVPAHG